MKILIASHSFAPSIGGIETCSLDLAGAFLKLGHEVQVITPTPSNSPDDDHGLSVIRHPGKSDYLRAVRWCDIYFQNNISLQTAWPLAFIRKPWVVCSQTWVKNSHGATGIVERVKKLALRFATNVYISKAIRDNVGHDGFIVHNPYNNQIFRTMSEMTRSRSLVFVGRLVNVKGCDLLLKSLTRLRDTGLSLPLKIIGAGPEEAALKKLIAAERLENLVQFIGPLRAQDLARELNRHLVLVVPSVWEEPFGIVALEGAACGCLVVGSEGGGLSEAIGPCGITFKNGDVDDLTRAIREIIKKPISEECCSQAVLDHLHNHTLEMVAARYIKIFEEALS